MSEIEYTLSVNLEPKDGVNATKNVSMGSIESAFEDKDMKINRNKKDDGVFYTLDFKQYEINFGPESLNSNFTGHVEDIKEFANIIDEAMEVYSEEIEEDLLYRGRVSLSKNTQIENKKVHNRSIGIEVEEVGLIGFEKSVDSEKYKFVVTEGDNNLRLTINAGISQVEEDENGVDDLETFVNMLRKNCEEVEKEINDNW